jgi:hypothetical protein
MASLVLLNEKGKSLMRVAFLFGQIPGQILNSPINGANLPINESIHGLNVILYLIIAFINRGHFMKFVFGFAKYTVGTKQFLLSLAI